MNRDRKHFVFTELELIKKLYDTHSAQDIAYMIGRSSARSIQCIALSRGWKTTRKGFGRRFSEREKQLIRDQYGKTPTKELAQHLGRSIRAIRDQAQKLNVATKPKKWTTKEIKMLRKQYPTQGKKTKIPNRTPRAIGKKAELLGIRYIGPHNENHPWKKGFQ